MKWDATGVFFQRRLSGEFEELVLAQDSSILCAGWEPHSHVSDRLWHYAGECSEGQPEWMPKTIR